jgi:hypothetical protein
VGAVVGKLAQRPAGRLQPAHRVGEVGAARIDDRHVVQAGHAVRLRRPARGLPRVEAEVMVVAAGGQEQHVARRAPARDVARLGDDVEAEDADVEAADAVDVGGAQVDVPDPRARGDRALGAGDGFQWLLAHQSVKLPSWTRADREYLRPCDSAPPWS